METGKRHKKDYICPLKVRHHAENARRLDQIFKRAEEILARALTKHPDADKAKLREWATEQAIKEIDRGKSGNKDK